LVYSDPTKQNSLTLTDQTRIDLDTLSNFTNSQYALFVFHQAGLVDPALTAGMALGTLALTTLLSGGMLIGYATKVSVFHTYLILLDLSTGKVVWSNYLPYDAAPTTPIIKISKDYENPITKYIKADTLSKRVLYRWHRYNLSAFPKIFIDSYSNDTSFGFSSPEVTHKISTPTVKAYLKYSYNVLDFVQFQISIGYDVFG
jgi:hypothetical protein